MDCADRMLWSSISAMEFQIENFNTALEKDPRSEWEQQAGVPGAGEPWLDQPIQGLEQLQQDEEQRWAQPQWMEQIQHPQSLRTPFYAQTPPQQLPPQSPLLQTQQLASEKLSLEQQPLPFQQPPMVPQPLPRDVGLMLQQPPMTPQPFPRDLAPVLQQPPMTPMQLPRDVGLLAQNPPMTPQPLPRDAGLVPQQPPMMPQALPRDAGMVPQQPPMTPQPLPRDVGPAPPSSLQQGGQLYQPSKARGPPPFLPGLATPIHSVSTDPMVRVATAQAWQRQAQQIAGMEEAALARASAAKGAAAQKREAMRQADQSRMKACLEAEEHSQAILQAQHCVEQAELEADRQRTIASEARNRLRIVQDIAKQHAQDVKRMAAIMQVEPAEQQQQQQQQFYRQPEAESSPFDGKKFAFDAKVEGIGFQGAAVEEPQV